jgi:hypothetical protein
MTFAVATEKRDRKQARERSERGREIKKEGGNIYSKKNKLREKEYRETKSGVEGVPYMNSGKNLWSILEFPYDLYFL